MDMNFKLTRVYGVIVRKEGEGMTFEHGGDLDPKKLLPIEMGVNETIQQILKLLGTEGGEAGEPGKEEDSPIILELVFDSDVIGNIRADVREMTVDRQSAENLILALTRVMSEIQIERMKANGMKATKISQRQAIDFTPVDELV